jgi:Protein of unknown function (DUF4058)
MPSPFPGIDPYLENSEFWSAVGRKAISNLYSEFSSDYRNLSTSIQKSRESPQVFWRFRQFIF